MRISRFYQTSEMVVGTSLNLTKDVSNHISRVLRLKDQQQIELFNGDGFNYTASIQITGKNVSAMILSQTLADNESPLNIHLGQAISRGERMDFTLQKSVELGVTSITPLITERVQFRYDAKRLQKKFNHWQKIIESACEQSGRAFVPCLKPALPLTNWLESESSPGMVFVPGATSKIAEFLSTNDMRLVVGPEGGLSDSEIALILKNHPFTATQLGPRILRTETAALAGISILQAQAGDL